MSLRTPAEDENGRFPSARFPRDSTFPRTRESRFVLCQISLDTRWSLS